MNQQLVNMAYPSSFRKEIFSLEEAIQFLWQDGVINVGELAEKAIVRKGKKLKQNSRGQKGSDFNDNSDSKYTTVAHYRQGSYATVGGFKHKIGTLRVVVYEPLTDKNYFFKIPHKVYAPYQNGDQTLKIWFDQNGNPRTPVKNTRCNLWKHKCSAEQWAK